jgi:hypothetical protein
VSAERAERDAEEAQHTGEEESGSFHGAHSAAPGTKDHDDRAPVDDLSCAVVSAREADPRDHAPIAPSLRVARLCPLPIGVLAWRAPEPTLTVIVKATFLLGADGKATLAAEQEPLWLDRPIVGGSFGDLDRACDFVPQKARVDVLLTGHAHAEAAMHVLPAGFAVDKLRRRVYATTEEPAVTTPLLPEYLRTATGEVTRVGARAMWAGTLDGAAIVNDDGVPCAPIPRGFDYTAFNVAPPEQQLEMLSLTAQIVLDGLGPGGRRTARLPGIKPRVFTLSGSGFGGARPPDEVVLRCDTIWIDADRSLCTLVWRGVIPTPPSAREAPSLVLAFDAGDRQQTWAKALDELDDATWSAPTSPEDAREMAAIVLDDDALEEDALDEEPSDDGDGPTTDRMAREAAARLDRDDDDDESTRTNVQLSRQSLPEILVDDEPSTDRRGASAVVAVSEPDDRPPLLVLGGFKGALASFEATRPPPAPAGRPQRPSGLRFDHAEDSTAVALAVRTPVLPAKAPSPPSAVDTSPVPFNVPVAPAVATMTALSFNLPGIPPAGATPALPFKAPLPAALPFGAPGTRAPTQPFARAPDAGSASLPFAAPIAEPRPFTRSNTIAPGPPPENAAAALPFAPAGRASSPSFSSLPSLGDLPSAPPPAEAAPEVHWSLVKPVGRTVGEAIISAEAAAPALAKVILQPAVEASKPALSMERYAEIKAEIWGGDATAAEVLERHEVDEAVFHDHERRLAQGLAREAAEGRSTLAIALRDALKLARDQLPSTGERPLRTLEDAYITLLTAIERAVDPSAILAAKGMSPSSWRRLRRRFEERAAADDKLRDALDVRLAAARKAAGGDTGGSSKWWNRREIAPANARRVPPKPRG